MSPEEAREARMWRRLDRIWWWALKHTTLLLEDPRGHFDTCAQMAYEAGYEDGKRDGQADRRGS